MKNLFCLLFSLIIFSSLSVFGQGKHPVRPYQKLEFLNFKPEWYETIFNQAMVGDSCDGYNFIFPSAGLNILRDKDDFYFAMTTRTLKDLHTGVFLQKRNINTGKLIWENAYDLKTIERQEVPRLIAKNKDGNIQLFNFIRQKPYLVKDPNLFQIWSDSMIFSWRLFDNENGNQFENFKVKESNSLFRYNRFISNGASEFIVDEEDKLRIVVYQNLFKKFNSLRINFKAEIDQIDSFFIRQPTNTHVQLKVINDNQFVLFDRFLSNKKASIKIFKTKSNFEIIEKGTSKDSIEKASDMLLADANDKGVIAANFQGSVFNRAYEFLVFDMQGNLRRRNALDTLGRYFANYEILSWDIDKPIYLLAHKNDVDASITYYNAWDVLKSNEKGGFDIVKRINFKDKLRLGLPVTILATVGDKFLFLFEELAYSVINENQYLYIQDGDAKAYSLMMISEKELGIDLNTSTHELSDGSQVKPIVKSNSDYLEISFNQAFTGELILFNLQGQIMRDMSISNSDYSEMNVSNLASGMYVLHSKQKGGMSYSQKVCVVRN